MTTNTLEPVASREPSDDLADLLGPVLDPQDPQAAEIDKIWKDLGFDRLNQLIWAYAAGQNRLVLVSWDHLDLPGSFYPTGAIVVLATDVDHARTVARASLAQRFADPDDARPWLEALDREPDVYEAPTALLLD